MGGGEERRTVGPHPTLDHPNDLLTERTLGYDSPISRSDFMSLFDHLELRKLLSNPYSLTSHGLLASNLNL
jgi:hypothetical protein